MRPRPARAARIAKTSRIRDNRLHNRGFPPPERSKPAYWRRGKPTRRVRVYRVGFHPTEFSVGIRLATVAKRETERVIVSRIRGRYADQAIPVGGFPLERAFRARSFFDLNEVAPNRRRAVAPRDNRAIPANYSAGEIRISRAMTKGLSPSSGAGILGR